MNELLATLHHDYSLTRVYLNQDQIERLEKNRTLEGRAISMGVNNGVFGAFVPIFRLELVPTTRETTKEEFIAEGYEQMPHLKPDLNKEFRLKLAQGDLDEVKALTPGLKSFHRVQPHYRNIEIYRI